MAEMLGATVARLDPRKFQDPFLTAKGEKRAQIALRSLDTLWFNTVRCAIWPAITAISSRRRKTIGSFI